MGMLGLMRDLRDMVLSSFHDGIFTQMDAVHRRIHAGKHWNIFHEFVGLTQGDNADILIMVPATDPECHATFTITTAVNGMLRIYRDTVSTGASGAELTPHNSNPNKVAETTDLRAFSAPVSIPTAGVTGHSLPIGSASNPQNVLGGDQATRRELILFKGSDYLFRFTAGGAGTATLEMDYYHHSD